MAQPGFIFGQGTADTYESLQAKRRTAERFGLGAMRTPQNLGEGLSSLGQAIAYRRLMNQADAGDAAGRAAYDEKRGSVLGALMGGALGGSAPAFNPSPSMPVTPNPAGLDPSIIKAVDRVNPQGREAEIRAGLIERGMAPHIADGFLMNFKDESGLDPGVNEAAPIVPGSRGGFGLAQWTGPRRVALEKFAAARGAAPSDVNVQLDFLMTELQGPESRAARNIFAAPDAGSAAAAIATDFLRPAPEHLERRVAEYTGMNPGASIPAIMEIMADPYAPQGDKMILGMLLEQQLAQMQPPDPMQALDMEYKRAQIEQMRAPQMAGPPQVETFYDEATGQPYKAQWDGQEWVPVGGVQAADGPMVDMSGLQIGGDNVPADDALRKKLMEGEGVAWGEYLKAGGTASGMAQDMDVIDELIQIAPQGPIQGRLAKVFPGVSDAGAAFQSVVSRVAPSLRVEGSGSTSDIEYNGFLQSMPSLVNRPDANAAIAGVLRAKAQINMDRAQVVRDYQNGTMSVDQARNKLSEIDSRSILTPGLKQMLTGLAPDAGIAPAPGATLTYNPQTGEFE